MRRVVISLLAMGVITLGAKTYATVGDTKITDKDINQVLKMIPNGALIQKYGGIDNLDEKKKKQIIDIAVENILLAKKAYKEGIDKTKEYKEKLQYIKNSLATSLYTQKIINSTKVTDKEAKEFYEKNKDKFTEKEEKVKARHILVKDEKEAKKIIDELKKAKDVEKKFIELAKKKSIGPSGVNGGELGFFTYKTMVEPFSKAAFALKKGEFTKKPVKTQFGYHVIFVEDKVKKGSLIPFENVKNDIKMKLKNDKIRKKMQKLIKELKKEYKVTYK